MWRILFLPLLAFSNLQAQEFKIVFTKQVNRNDNIYALNEKGEISQVTNHSSKDSSPSISPDGKHMAFTSERVGWWKIWIMDMQTKAVEQLTNSGSAEYNPSWSPDSKHIIFVSGRDGNDEIYKMDYDGENVINLTNNSVSDNLPSWGADNKIYYSSLIDDVYQIIRMNPDGTKKKVITNGEGDKLMPKLSPNLATILFYSNLDGNFELYTLSIKDNKITRLTNHPLLDMRGQWSSDGSKIVFERGDKGKNHHILIMNSDGTDVKQLTDKDYNYAASFVPMRTN